MIRIGSMPTSVQNSSSPPSTIGPAGHRSDGQDVLVVVSVVVDVVVEQRGRCLFVRLLGRRFGQLVGGACGQLLVDVGGGDDLVDGGEHAVPAAADDRGDVAPPFAAGLAGEFPDARVDAGQRGVAVEELRDRRQFAHRADRRHDGQRVGDLLHRLLGGLLGEQLLEADQVELVVLVRVEPVRRRLGEPAQAGVFGEIVVGVTAHERHQVSGAVEAERSSPLPRNASHSSPASRQRGAHRV